MIWLDDKNVLHVKDWNTDGKTLLNERPLDSEVILSIGDQIDIGSNRIVPVLNVELNGDSDQDQDRPQNDSVAATSETDAAGQVSPSFDASAQLLRC